VKDRISKTTLLCEDDGHAMLVRSYWKLCKQSVTSSPLEVKNASRIVRGGNIGWVLDQFPKELEAARSRHSARANTLLIVVADADDLSVAMREHNLCDREAYTDSDPLVVLIPKRHIETWVCSAIGGLVGENEDCKRHHLTKADFREAAKRIHDWARNDPSDDSTCVPSLRVALSRWKRIG